MQIRSAKFIKGIVKEDILLEDGKPQVAFIGRSNVGKSSTINTLTGQKGLAKTSDFPGKTTEINLFLMKNYSSNRAQKGKTAYRTPDRFIYKMALKSIRNKQRLKKNSPERGAVFSNK